MSLLKKLAGETVLYGLSSILPRVLSFVIMTPYFTNGKMSTAEYGVFSDLYSTLAMVSIVVTFRMETAFFRYGKDPAQADRAFTTASFFVAALTSLFLLFSLIFIEPIARGLKYEGQTYLIAMVLGILTFEAFSAVPFARLRFANRPLRFLFLKVLNVLFIIGFTSFFLDICPWLEQKPGWTWLQNLHFHGSPESDAFLANLLASGLTCLQLLPQFLRVRWQVDWALLRQMSVYAWPLVIAGVAGTVNQQIGTPLLKYMSSMSQVGLFNGASKIAVLLNLFTTAFNYAAEPFFFRNADRGEAKVMYGQVAQAFTLVCSLAIAGILLGLDLVVAARFVGPEFTDGFGIVPIMLLANLFLGLFYSFSIWYKLADRTNVGGALAIIGSIISIGLNVWLIPRIGYYAPAWAALACYAYMAIASYLSGQKHYPIAYPIKRMALYVSLTVLVYALSQGFRALLIKNGVPAQLDKLDLLEKWPILTLNLLLLLTLLAAFAYIERNLLKRFLKRSK
jgi:O-antigen/teichoic acid export membrane protein